MRRPVALALVVALAAGSCVVGRKERADPLPPPPGQVQVVMRDFRYDYDKAVPGGRVVFRVRNEGSVEHSLTLINLPEDYPPIDEQLRGEVRRGAPTIALIPSRPPGGGGTFAVDLVPGRYAFVCFVADADGVLHALKGMNSEFRIS